MNVSTKALLAVPTNARRALHAVAAGSAVLALTACASTDAQPDPQIARAETSIRQAEQSGAPEHSAHELDMAREKLSQAQLAANNEEYVLAERLAEEASADAELAAALARTAEAETAVEEIQATLASLRQEVARQQQ